MSNNNKFVLRESKLWAGLMLLRVILVFTCVVSLFLSLLFGATSVIWIVLLPIVLIIEFGFAIGQTFTKKRRK